MHRKHKMIINRHTWNLQQFEFSVPYSYEDCIGRLQQLQTEFQAQPVDNRRWRPSLTLDFEDEVSSFTMVLDMATVKGTVQKITATSTLFVGLSEFDLSFYGITIAFLVVGCIFLVLPFLSSYVLSVPIDSPKTSGVLNVIPWLVIGILLFYIMFRWAVWRGVTKLIATVDY
ncbi:MAG: hypothetical protein GC179_01860 [Anaerolineaceae bacterium]|nr:hypothetical protein [Anaerolineaceae bacterium]